MDSNHSHSHLPMKKALIHRLVVGLPVAAALCFSWTHSRAQPAGKIAPKPLYRDPVYDGAADPVLRTQLPTERSETSGRLCSTQPASYNRSTAPGGIVGPLAVREERSMNKLCVIDTAG